jgi:hypothetical protein
VNPAKYALVSAVIFGTESAAYDAAEMLAFVVVPFEASKVAAPPAVRVITLRPEEVTAEAVNPCPASAAEAAGFELPVAEAARPTVAVILLRNSWSVPPGAAVTVLLASNVSVNPLANAAASTVRVSKYMPFTALLLTEDRNAVAGKAGV